MVPSGFLRGDIILDKRIALVTGASSGIGAATAVLLVKQGYEVWGTIRSLPKVAQLPEELQKGVRFVEMDVTSDESVQQGMDQVLKAAGHLDVLVNNAGFGIFGSIEETPVELVRTQMETNYMGTLRVLQAALPGMRERRSGTIINVSSLAAHFVIPFQVHYSASKFAIRALTEGLRQELRPFKIRAFAVEPGDIKTKFNDATKFGPTGESPYGKWRDAAWQMIDQNMQVAPPPEVVAKTILKVIQKATGFRGHYPAGDFISRQFPWLGRFMPDGVKEWAIRVFYGIQKV